MAAPKNPYRGGNAGRRVTIGIRRHLVNIGRRGGAAAGAVRSADQAAKWAALAEGRDGATVARISNYRGYQNGFRTGRRRGYGEGFEEGYEAALLEIRRLVMQGAGPFEALRAAGQVVKVG